ncbi:metal ABC transporter permease [Pontibacillus litoralis]|uniref:Manganese transport system membrane protein MntC n=1 Tax=Pontibacillus litoralis JSM 072002 TaxID=1385512 RepID=A0A0A5G5H5_9BACI|nr:iron chelate uptake ABC transporter family permease subunit [Pontibacillus litoralis]KGX87314.1 manganese ABC transporter [Pontibacillus litoralis JSM 072002]
MENLLYLLSNANTQWVLMGSLILGFASGVIGSFVLLKKQSLIGDAMAHATLPGVCLAFLVIGEKSTPIFLIGAAVTGLISTYLIQAIVKHSRIKTDAAIGVVLSVSFGLGIVLLTYITQNTSGDKSGIDEFIFGQAASMVRSDIQVIAVGSVVILLVSTLFFKELKVSIFDPLYAKGIGLPVNLLNGVLMALVVGIVVVGIQMVGVVLIAALLITPPLAARYWTDQLGRMSFLAGIIGALSGVFGTLISTIGNGLPTGPLIVLCASVIFLISLLLGTRKGLITKVVRHA